MADLDRDAAADARAAGTATMATARARLEAAIAGCEPARAARLTDYQRATVTRMVTAIIEELRSFLSLRWPEIMPLADLLPRLGGAVLLRERRLIARLLRRADEHRVAMRRPIGSNAVFSGLANDQDALVGGAARALILADAARYDRFNDPLLRASDLPPREFRRAVWLVAAAGRPGAADAVSDRRATTAAVALLAAYEDGRSVDALADTLVRALEGAARLDDAMVVGLAETAPLPALVAALAMRSEIAVRGAWEMVLDPGGGRLALLLKAAEIDRAMAERVLRACVPGADAPGLTAAADAIEVARMVEAIRLWRLNPAFRSAIMAVRP